MGITGAETPTTGCMMKGMEFALRVQIERLPEGVYLATSDELPGQVAQGRTVAGTVGIARDVARKLLEAGRERKDAIPLRTAREPCDYTIVMGA